MPRYDTIRGGDVNSRRRLGLANFSGGYLDNGAVSPAPLPGISGRRTTGGPRVRRPSDRESIPQLPAETQL